MVVNGAQLLAKAPIKRMEYRKHTAHGVTFGLTECGYDIRLKQTIWLFPGRRFVLGSSMEEFDMPNSLMGQVLNKSTWARRGVDASATTNIEPGWKGWLTIELHYRRWLPIKIPAGAGIAQVIFHQVCEPAQYRGRYQDQADRPVPAKAA